MSWLVTNIWLIPAVPLAFSLLILFLSNSRRAAAAGFAIIGQIIALAFSILAFLPTLANSGLPRCSEFHLVHLR